MSLGREHIDRIEAALTNFEDDLDEQGEAFGEHLRGKELLIRVLVAVMVLLSLVNIYFVNDLTAEVRAITQGMNEMSNHFDNVGRRMDGLTASVQQMTGNVAMLPVVSEQMGEMSLYVSSMRADVRQLQQRTQAVDQRVGKLSDDVTWMSSSFRRVNRSVGSMGRDVQEMARPMP